MLSPSDTAIIFVVALLLFGPEQLPKIARQLGEAMRNIQHTTQSFMNELERAATVSDASDVSEPLGEGAAPAADSAPADLGSRGPADDWPKPPEERATAP